MLIATCCLPVQLCPAGAAEVPHSFILFRNCSGLIVPIGGAQARTLPSVAFGRGGGSDFETSAAPSTAHTLVKSAAWGVTHDV